MLDRGAPSSVQTLFVAFIAATAALGGFLFGFDSAVINGAVGGLQRSFRSSSAGTGFAVASILLGCAVGALLAGRLAERSGRRPVMLLSAVIFAVTALGAGLASTSALFILARFVSGIAVGAASVVCPAYIAEISPPAMRGRLASLQQLGIVAGIFVALLSDALLAAAAGGASARFHGMEAWRWMFVVEVAPSILFGLAAALIPESPRFLVARSREDDAREVLQRIDPGTAEETLAEIRATVRTERAPSLSDLRAPEGGLLAIVWIGVALSALQQLVGINSIFYYGAVLWESVGFNSGDSLRINVVTGVVNIAATLVAMGFVDRVGRKPLLLWGSVAMALTLAVLVAALVLGASHDGGGLVLSRNAGITALLAANLYVFAFGVSWGPCVWILLGEMFPNRIRGSAMALAVFAQWIANWVVTVTFPPLVSGLGASGAYVLYLLFAGVSFFFVRRFIQETRGRTLEEM